MTRQFAYSVFLPMGGIKRAVQSRHFMRKIAQKFSLTGWWCRPVIVVTWGAEAGRSQVKVNLGNLERPCLKLKSKRGVGTAQ